MTLRVGSRGEEVSRLQASLAAKGFDPGPIDGIYGDRTRNAVILFQKASNLPVTGIADDTTLKSLTPGVLGMAITPTTIAAFIVLTGGLVYYMSAGRK